MDDPVPLISERKMDDSRSQPSVPRIADLFEKFLFGPRHTIVQKCKYFEIAVT